MDTSPVNQNGHNLHKYFWLNLDIMLILYLPSSLLESANGIFINQLPIPHCLLERRISIIALLYIRGSLCSIHFFVTLFAFRDQ